MNFIFYFSGSVASNSPGVSSFSYNVCVVQQRVYQTTFRNVDEFDWYGAEHYRHSILLSPKRGSICVSVFAQRADISNIYCKQLDNWTIG